MTMGFPNFPGVPALSQSSLNSLNTASAALGAASLISTLFTKSINPVWAITIGSGNTPLIFDNFISIDFKNDMNVATYPIEQGGFNSYNKVNNPYYAVVKISVGSGYSANEGLDVDSRNSILSILNSLLKSTVLCTIITPERSYSNANLEAYNFRRELRNGAGIIIAELHFVEILSAATTVVTNTPTTVTPDPTATVPSAQASVNLGMIQLGSTYKSAIPNIL